MRRLPGSDLEVSAVGLGCWALGGVYWGDDVRDDRSQEAVRAALDCGITLFDTAPLYGSGHADEVLVHALGERRHDVVIATKCGVREGEPGGHAQSDGDPAWIREDTERSLGRLGLDCIPLLQMHWPCERGVPLQDTVGELVALRDEGKIRWFGLCNYDAAALASVSGAPGLVSLQTPYSLLRREFEGELRDACQTHGLGVLAYEPLARGLLTGKFTHPPSFPDSDLRSRDDRFVGARFRRAAAFARDLGRVASKLGVPTSAVALAWAAHRPGVTAVLAGAKTAEQVRANAQASRLLQATRIWKTLDAIADTWTG